MRKIKFRAWDLSEKRWDKFHSEYSNHRGAERYFSTSKEFIRFNRGDIILMQFTGTHDKNGKEIYEGDIIAYPGATKVFWEVVWDGRREDLPIGIVLKFFGIKSNVPQYMHPSVDSLEIIGNIYENPELLKEKP